MYTVSANGSMNPPLLEMTSDDIHYVAGMLGFTVIKDGPDSTFHSQHIPLLAESLMHTEDFAQNGTLDEAEALHLLAQCVLRPPGVQQIGTDSELQYHVGNTIFRGKMAECLTQILHQKPVLIEKHNTPGMDMRYRDDDSRYEVRKSLGEGYFKALRTEMKVPDKKPRKKWFGQNSALTTAIGWMLGGGHHKKDHQFKL